MPTRNKLYSVIGTLVGLAYLLLAILGADGVIWIIPVIVASAAYAVVGGLTRR